MTNPMTATPRYTKPAEDVDVRQLRLLLQSPLVLDGSNNNTAEKSTANNAWIRDEIKKTQTALAQGKWKAVPDPLEYPPAIDPKDTDSGGYGQFAYFHDFVQKFLFSKGDNPPFTLYERTDIREFHLWLPGGGEKPSHRFQVDRLSLHLFDFGTAIVTLELDWQGKAAKGPLNLAEVQDIIDHIRRTYTPFWIGKTPQRVPKKVELVGEDKDIICRSHPFPKDQAEKALANNDARDIKVFDHWAEIINPLQLMCEGGCWRDPSDERMPINSFIALDYEEIPKSEADRVEKLPEPEKTIAKEKNNLLIASRTRAAVLAIRESDWIRLADAEESGTEESGTDYPYNPDFIVPIAEAMYYDRFFPHKDAGAVAARHIFGGPHYAVVGAGWFMDNILIHHFRRHYALLSLIARFESTALLAISSRLTNAVIRLEQSGDERAFEHDVIEIQGQFLNFVHRFRFSGISSQLQAREMFDRWRASLGLEVMYQDVRQEVDTAFQRVTALQQKREAGATSDLSKLAAVGVFLGLIAGVMGSNIFLGKGQLLGASPDWLQFWFIAAVIAMVMPAAALTLLWAKKTRLKNWLYCLASVGIVAFVLALAFAASQ